MHGIRREDRGRNGRGQSMVELAMIMPILCLLLLGAVDFAQVSSAQLRLEHAAHLATIRLLADHTLDVPAFVRATSGLSTATATVSYGTDTNGADQVTVRATYDYPLLLPGLRNLQMRTISDGKLHIAVQAAGIMTTDPPTLTPNYAGPNLDKIQVAPPTGGTGTTPSGLTYSCTLQDSLGHIWSSPLPCTSLQAGPGNSNPPQLDTTVGTIYTATVTQVNGVTSLPVTMTVR